MTTTTTIRTTIAGLVAAALVAPAALAGGEPKNDRPFTRSVADRATSQVNHSQPPWAAVAAGEPKNEWPFTRRVTDRPSAGQVGSGEPKNEQPFTRPVVTPTVIAQPNGFDWGDAAIGLAAGLGLALAVAGGLVLATHRLPRLRKTGAAAAG